MPKPGPRTTFKYSDEFKPTAVRLSELAGVEVQDVAASLYIHPFMLSRWRKQAREGQMVTKGVEVDKQVAAELKELRKIKRAYERLRWAPDLIPESVQLWESHQETSRLALRSVQRSELQWPLRFGAPNAVTLHRTTMDSSRMDVSGYKLLSSAQVPPNKRLCC